MSLKDAAMRMAQSKLMQGGLNLSGATDLAHLLQSRPSGEKLEPWREAWLDQIVSTMLTFAPPGATENPQMREFARNQMMKWVMERNVEDARETAMAMLATAQKLLDALPASTVEYPSLPGSKVEA